jgi:hypothetical protein
MAGGSCADGGGDLIASIFESGAVPSRCANIIGDCCAPLPLPRDNPRDDGGEDGTDLLAVQHAAE